MKQIIFGLFIIIALQTQAQSDKYTSAMVAALSELKDAKVADDINAVAAKFIRIGDAEKNQWLPYYYAALTKARMSFMHFGNPDDLADEANTIIAKAEAISANNSEILCVKSMISSCKLLVDPQSRWQEYGAKSNQFIAQSKAADSTNPRPWVLEAMGLKNMPEQFGGGCKRAKPSAEKAEALYSIFKAASELAPTWGKDLVDPIIAECK